MEATELRIGNFVLWKDEIAIVSQILELEIVFKCGDIGFIKDCKPIPITEKRLQKFGYRFTEGITYFFNEKTPIIYCIKKGNKIKILKNIASIVNEIKYIHEFQNILFALIGEELIFNN